MRKPSATTAVGLGAILSLDVALNLLLLRQELFVAPVVIPFLVGLVLGVLWGVLALTRLAGSADRGKAAQALNAVIASVLFLCICVAVFAIAKRLHLSYDLTREGRRDLAPQTIQVLEGLDRDVRAYGLFISTGDEQASMREEKTRRFLERCRQVSPHLQIEFFDPEEDQLKLMQLGVPRVSVLGCVVLKSGDSRARVIPLSSVTERLEEREFTGALIGVSRDTKPKVYFLTGHGERAPDDADPAEGATVLSALLSGESYAVDTLDLSEGGQVPPECELLLINGQNKDLRPREVAALNAYMDSGGRLLLLMDFWYVQRLPGQDASEQLRPWLEQRYGIRVGEDLVLSREHSTKVILVPTFGPEVGECEYRGSFDDDHMITRVLDQPILFTGARSVSLADSMPEGVVGEVLLRTSPEYWAETNLKLLLESEPSFAQPDPADLQGCIPVAVAVTARTGAAVGDTGQTRDARLVVIGNREFASNGKLREDAYPQHANLAMNAVAWLTESDDLIAIRPTGQKDPAIILTPAQEQVVAWISSLGMLHVVLFVGLIVYRARRKYQ